MTSFIHDLLYKRNDFNKKSKSILLKFGMYKIKTIIIGRIKLNFILNNLARFFSSKDQYDKYYHIFIKVELENNQTILIEKNQVINISNKIPKYKHNDEYITLDIKHHPTLNRFLENSRKMRPNFFMYKSVGNNCQNFIDDLLTDNNMNNTHISQFILQDVTDIVEENIPLRKFLNFTTDTAARIDVLK